MANVSRDVMEIVFATKGIEGVLNDFQRIENASRRADRASAAQKQAGERYGTGSRQYERAAATAGDAARVADEVALRSHTSGAMARATAAVALLREEVNLIKEGVEEYQNYASEIRTIKSLSGSTTRQAEQFVNLSAIAGVPSSVSTREIGMMAKSMNSDKGREDMQKLGVTPTDNTLENFTKVIAALGKMKDGAEKTRIEYEIMGARGARAAQPFLQMQSDIIERSNQLNANLDGPGMQAITHLQQNFGLLGQTMLVDFVVPIISKIVPAIDWLVTSISDVITWFHELDEMMGGALSWAVIFVGIAGSVLLVVSTIKSLIAVYALLKDAQIIQIAIQATLDAFSGNYAALAAGLAVAATAGIAIAYNSSQGGDDKKGAGSDIKDSAASFKQSVGEFGAAVQKHTSSWSAIAGGQLGNGMTEANYAFLMQQGAEGAIG